MRHRTALSACCCTLAFLPQVISAGRQMGACCIPSGDALQNLTAILWIPCADYSQTRTLYTSQFKGIVPDMYLLYGCGDVLQDLAAVLGVPCQDGRSDVAELVLWAEAVCAGIVRPALGLALGCGQREWAGAVARQRHEHCAWGQVAGWDAHRGCILDDLEGAVCRHLAMDD